MIGVSKKPNHFSRMLFRSLTEKGFDVLPVNPGLTEVDGKPCFSRLSECSPVGGALFMTSPKLTEALAPECAEAGVKVVWMYSAVGTGAVSEKAVRYLENRGIRVIAGGCPYMFVEAGRFPHNVHAGLLKLFGCYPR
jgi:predicted CoA-binding protein